MLAERAHDLVTGLRIRIGRYVDAYADADVEVVAGALGARIAEADQYGFEFYVRAGWDPAKFGDFFQQLIDKGYDKTPEIQSDHPSLSSRVQAARTRAQQLPSEAQQWRHAPIADAARFAALKTRAAQVAQTSKKEGELGKAQLLLRSVPSCLLAVNTPEQKDAVAQLKAAYAAAHKSEPAKK